MFGSQTVVIEHGESFFGCRLIVSGVVSQTCDSGVREFFVRNPVLLTQLHGLHADFGRKLIDDSFYRVGGFRPAGTAIGICRSLVSEHARAGEVIGIHLVNRWVHEHAKKWNPGGDYLQVGSHIGQKRDLEAEDLSVLGGSDFDILNLVAAMVGCDHVLTSSLGPLNRPTKFLSEVGDEDFLAVDLQFAAEATAHIRCDNA